jgi:hypothetical protein
MKSLVGIKLMKRPSAKNKHDDLRSCSLLDLSRRIAVFDDEDALKEFFRRKLFHTNKKSRLCIIELLDIFRIRAGRRTWRPSKAIETADMAYDITLDKFINLPTDNQKGIDRRRYWRAFIKHVENDFAKHPPKGHLDQKLRTTNALQKFITRHYFLSLQEAERRTSDFWSRYTWRIDDHSITLWMPKFLKGSERRRWLEKNIKDPDLSRSGERQRIQKIVGERLVNMAWVRLQDNVGSDPTDAIIDDISGGEAFAVSLAQYVADEKSGDIANQRRSIKKLGQSKLKQLVLRVFAEIEAGDNHDQQIAKEFGLSKATFSRFAGSRWRDADRIPDLWMNTAQVLASKPEFKEAAIEAGVWRDVEETLTKTNRN